MPSLRTYILTLALPLSLATVGASNAAAQLTPQKPQPSPESEAETRARLARRGAGLTVGNWDVRGLEPPDGVSVSNTPLFSAWVRKGLDKRIALENGLSLWRRQQNLPASGGIGGSPAEQVQSWIFAQTTAVRFFPFTDAGARFEPFVLAGAGFSLGVDDRQTESGGVLGGATGRDGLQFVPGFSAQAAAGAEFMLGESFGVTGGTRYQWTRFFQEFGGERTYQGPVYEAGLTYKFRY